MKTMLTLALTFLVAASVNAAASQGQCNANNGQSENATTRDCCQGGVQTVFGDLFCNLKDDNQKSEFSFCCEEAGTRPAFRAGGKSQPAASPTAKKAAQPAGSAAKSKNSKKPAAKPKRPTRINRVRMA